MQAAPETIIKIRRKADNRAQWWKLVRTLHWVSSALCLVGMLLFSITGITLNHAAAISAESEVKIVESQLPEPLLAELAQAAAEGASSESSPASLPIPLENWLRQELDIRLDAGEIEWSATELYLSLPRPGGDAWLSLDTTSGELLYEQTDRGWIAWLNDLHKGRDTGTVWRWFIDIFAAATIVFSLTGLFLLYLHAGKRPTTWTVTGLGLLLPWLLILLFVP